MITSPPLSNEAPPEHRSRSLTVLRTVVTNILSNPMDPRYLKINMKGGAWASLIAGMHNEPVFCEWLGRQLHASFDGASAILGASLLTPAVMSMPPLQRMHEPHFKSWMGQCEATAQVIAEAIKKSSEPTLALQMPANHAQMTEWLRKEVVGALMTDDEWCWISQAITGKEVSQAITGLHGATPPSDRCTLVVDAFKKSFGQDVLDAEGLQVITDDLFNAWNAFGERSAECRRKAKQRAKQEADAAHLDAVRAKGHHKWDAELVRTATSVAVDIGGLMELCYLLEGSVGYERKDRKEVPRLLDKFYRDGDIQYLHERKAEWEERVEALKAKAGKNFVFLSGEET